MSCNKLHSRRRVYYLSRMVARLKILFLLGLALLLAAPAPASIPRTVFQPVTEKSASGELTRYIHSGEICHLVRDFADPLKRPLMECGSFGNPVRVWIWANGRLIAQLHFSGAKQFAHTDELGNLIALTDPTGHITDQFAYDPYGQLIARTGTTDIPFTWLANYAVVDLGENLYITLHRPYHAGYARFLSKDPLGLDGGLNLFAYAEGNPLFYLDYLGLCKTESSQQNRTLSEHETSRLNQYVNPNDIQRALNEGITAYRENGTAGVTDYFATNPRYVFNQDIGWIDLQHVSSAARVAEDTFTGMGSIAGLGVEVNQAIGGAARLITPQSEIGQDLRSSAFSMEDILSNSIGDSIGNNGNQALPNELLPGSLLPQQAAGSLILIRKQYGD